LEQTEVYLRADGNSQKGLGHVHRLLALGQMLKGKFKCTFVIRTVMPGIHNLISEACDQLIELDREGDGDERWFIRKPGEQKCIVVLDGYDFSTDYQQRIRESGAALVCLDDIHAYHFVADVIINPAGGVSEANYSAESHTKIYTGPRYAMLKEPFVRPVRDEVTSKPLSVLICFGGADPANFTQRILVQLRSATASEIHVIVGEAFMHRSDLEKLVGPDKQAHLHQNLHPVELARLMEQCPVAVCSASGIAYEYLSVGGELYVIQTADNQKDLYRYLIDEHLAFPFENFRATAADVSTSRTVQRELFDGKSKERILRIFHKLDFKLNSTVRTAVTDDVMTLFHWANDPELRRQSYNPAAITLEDHTRWFNRKLTDAKSIIYIFEYKNIPVAMVRFDIGDEATISYSIDKDFRGRGWGEEVLRLAIKTFVEAYGRQNIVGYVKMNNEGSNKIFRNIGFKQFNTEAYPFSYKYELQDDK
jgi:UDP-2,4-diacetamido-2,4,6-trideoxy-beta-L-altropyranose hydrolase